MMYSLIQRKESPISKRDWLTIPWQDGNKSVEQMVFDQGLALGSLFERADAAFRSAPDLVGLLNIFQECVTLENQTENLLKDYITTLRLFSDGEMPMSLHWMLNAALLPTKPPELMLCITVVSIQLGACATGVDVWNDLRPYCDPSTPPEAMNGLALALESKRRPLAKVLTHLTKSYLLVKTGAMGAARIVFALRLARAELTLDDAEFGICQELLARFNGEAWQFGVPIDPRNNSAAKQSSIMHSEQTPLKLYEIPFEKE